MSSLKGYVGSGYLQLLEEQMMDFKRKSYARMNVHAGNSVLDVGCGPGTDTIHLARLVGSTGEVVGIDHDAGMLAQANQRALAAGVGDVVKHEQGNASSLPFHEARFDSARSERLFQHLICPERALFEMARVTKPGGSVVVLDTDWATLSIHTLLPEVERRLVQFSNEGCITNGYSGRALPQLFAAQGLRNIMIEVLPYSISSYGLCRDVLVLDRREADALAASAIGQDELDRWHQDLEKLDRVGGFFATFTLVLVAGNV